MENARQGSEKILKLIKFYESREGEKKVVFMLNEMFMR